MAIQQIVPQNVGIPTVIDIEITLPGDDDYEGSVYYGRTNTTYRLTSNVKPVNTYVNHLGFRVRRINDERIRRVEDKYTCLYMLDPLCNIQTTVKPFYVTCDNEGDSLMRVSVRLPGGNKDIVMVAINRGEQVYEAKPYKRVDEDVYYASFVIGPYTTAHIEEVAR